SIGRRLFYDYLRRRKLFMNFQLVELRKKVKTHYEIETDFKESDLDFLLSLLNEKERDLLCLAYEEQKSHREIAEICGLKEKSVKVLLARYRTKLRRLAVEKKLELGDKYGRE
ncbi:MAG: hypothetical protein KDD94_01450, partial [Calditrichaeota bacterium]|nr:hypothetical protein [Calditrichota bacterium]